MQIWTLDVLLVITYFLLRSSVCSQLVFDLIFLLPETIHGKINHACQFKMSEIVQEAIAKLTRMFKEQLQSAIIRVKDGRWNGLWGELRAAYKILPIKRN